MKKIFAIVFLLNNNFYTFLSGIFISTAINLYTTLVIDNTTVVSKDLILAIVEMLLASFILLILSIILQPLQDTYKQTPLTIIKEYGRYITWSEIVSRYLILLYILVVITTILTGFSIRSLYFYKIAMTKTID